MHLNKLRFACLVITAIFLSACSTGGMSSLPSQATVAQATATPVPPTSTPRPVESGPTPELSLTPTLSAADLVTPSPTPAPDPLVVANTGVNVRVGPGTNHPVVSGLKAGESARIIGRSDSSGWWQIELASGLVGWVYGQVVDTLGDVAEIAVALDIPTPPPTDTPAPQPTDIPAPQPTNTPEQALPTAPHFSLVGYRLWNVEENGGHMDGPSLHCGEKHELQVIVVDPAGNRLNGVTVGSIYNSEESVTGDKGPGQTEFVLFPPGNGVRVKRDVDGRDVSSDPAEAPTDPRKISYDLLIGGGFCRNEADCNTFTALPGCFGHYSWTVTFQRNY